MSANDLQNVYGQDTGGFMSMSRDEREAFIRTASTAVSVYRTNPGTQYVTVDGTHVTVTVDNRNPNEAKAFITPTADGKPAGTALIRIPRPAGVTLPEDAAAWTKTDADTIRAVTAPYTAARA